MSKTYLVLTPFFPSKRNFRGAYIYDQLVAIQNNSDFDIKVVLLNSLFNREEKEKYNYQGIDCIPFCVWDLPSFLFPGLVHKINNWRFQSFLKANRIALSKKSIIHAHVTYPAGYLARDISFLSGAKSVCQHHGLDVYQLRTGRLAKGVVKVLQNKLLKRRSQKVLSQININVGVSQKVLDELGRGINSQKIVLHNGVDVNKFYPLKQNRENTKFIIGCIGNFWKIKDQISLLKAALILKDKGVENIKIIFIGSGETLELCQKFAQEYQLDCEFRREVDHVQLNVFYNQLDLFVLPSYYEAFGCVYTEAWAASVPFIAVHGQGIEEVMTEEMKRKQLVNKEDPQDIANKIFHFYNHSKKIYFNDYLSIENTIKNFLNNLSGD